jgi:cation diffusion facilitator family transporter
VAQRESVVTVITAVGANLAITVAKGIAAVATGSAAMAAEAIHSAVDTANETLLLVGMRRAEKAPDAQHPFGYAPELYFWTFVVAVVIFGLGGGLTIMEGIDRLRDPHLPSNPLWNYVVLGVAFVFESISFFVAVRQLRRDEPGVSLFAAVKQSKDPSVFAVVLEDTAALIGLVIALAGTIVAQVTADGRADGVASIAIGAVLDVVAIVLVWQVRGLLVGESADPEVLDAIREIAAAEPSVDVVRRVLTMHLGPEDILVALDLIFRPDAALTEVATAIDRIQIEAKRRVPAVREIFIEVDALTGHASRPGSS